MIHARELRKSYANVQAVDGVSLDLVAGETFGLLGPNGAGKTTTIHMLIGVIRPDSGEVSIQGVPDPTRAEVRRQLGVAPQIESLYDELSAAENLAFFGRLYGLGGVCLKERVTWCLGLAGLRDRATDRVKTYSGGMKRRLNLACALVHDPPVLLFDEPTAGVDPQSRNHLLDTIEGFARAGRTILYTTHYMEEAERLCDRVAIMDQGQILALGTPADLVATQGGGFIEVGLRETGEGIVERMNDIPAIRSALLSDHTLSLRSRGTNAALAPLINALSAGGAVVGSLSILEPNLETVFLSLTGKHLRD